MASFDFKVSADSANADKLRTLLTSVAIVAPFGVTVADLVAAPPVEPPKDVPPVEPDLPDEPEPTEPTEPAPVGEADRYVSANGTGDGSKGNPAPVSKINEMILAAGKDGVVELVGDFAQSAIRINAAPASQVTIRGGTFTGDRFPYTKPSSEKGTRVSSPGGGTVFIIQNGARNLRFEGQTFRNVGIAFDKNNTKGSNLEFVNITLHNVRDGFSSNEGTEIVGLLYENIKATGYSKKAIRLHGNSSKIVVRNAQLDSGWIEGDNFAAGIEMYDTVHDILIEGGWAGNVRDTQGGSQSKYWNADCISSERGVYDVKIRGFRGFNSTDGGLDLKSTKTIVEDCVFEDCKRNIRIWGEATVRNCTSIRPKHRGGSGGEMHVWAGNGAKLTLENFTAIGPGLLAENDGAAFLKINGLTLKEGATAETMGKVEIA